MDNNKRNIRRTERFWSKVKQNDNGCLEWQAGKDKDGYGVFYNRDIDQNERAHRRAWIIEFGSIDNNLLLMHTCDNPCCVNVKHLKLGKTQDNVNDKVGKKRHFGWKWKNSDNHHSKHSDEFYKEILRFKLQGLKGPEIAKILNLSKCVIYNAYKIIREKGLTL